MPTKEAAQTQSAVEHPTTVVEVAGEHANTVSGGPGSQDPPPADAAPAVAGALDDGERPPPSADTDADPLIGRVVADRYRIVGHVGRGGMGVVYKVEHLRIGKLMAMKLLSGELSRNRDVVRRFKREALAASRLTSINTVQVWDFGHSDGLTYLVMELVVGEDFGKVLRASGPISFQRTAQIAVQACNSLIEAHNRGIVHRDLKPENLLILHPEGSKLQDLVKVLDFGLAKLHEDDRPNQNDTTTAGAIVGTPYYMAPEQIRAEVVDGRADLYALGAVMYRAVTGVTPFVGTSPMAVLTQHLTEPLIMPNDRAPTLGIPQEASRIIAKALEKNAANRYASATALREDLIDYLTRRGVSGGFLNSGAIEAASSSAFLPASSPPPPPVLAGSAGSEGSAGSRQASHVPVELSPRKRPATRSDVGRYAQALHRKSTYAVVIALAFVGGGAFAFKDWGKKIEHTDAQSSVGEEVEPNNDVLNANVLRLGTPIRGFLGKRIAADAGDVDFYAIDVPGSAGERALLEIDLAPLPNIPLCLELARADQAARPVGIFCRKIGEKLHLNAVSVTSGRYNLKVSQDRTADVSGNAADVLPVYENVSDTYVLRVALAANAQGLEVEPNNALDSAQSLPLDTTVTAQLSYRGDEDVFCARPSPSGSARFVIVDRARETRDEARLEVESMAGESSKGKSLIAKTDGARGSAGPAKWTSAPFSLSDHDHHCIVVRPHAPAKSSAKSATDDGFDVTLERAAP
ncbi:MAG: hypothetical protein NVS3B20_02990 [Polyangiales bacterium]